MATIRIPTSLILQLALEIQLHPNGERWLLDTSGGNILGVTRVRGIQTECLGSRLDGTPNPPRAYDAIDFEYNPGD